VVKTGASCLNPPPTIRVILLIRGQSGLSDAARLFFKPAQNQQYTKITMIHKMLYIQLNKISF